MAILLYVDQQGGVYAADEDSGATAYAFPFSANATRAKRSPRSVAEDMIGRPRTELAAWRDMTRVKGMPTPSHIVEYHARNWDVVRRADAAGNVVRFS